MSTVSILPTPPKTGTAQSRMQGEAFLALLLGFAVFYAAFGLSILNPAHIDWLLHGDPAQHYFGWAFFRYEAWGWPPGLLTGLAAPLQTSIVFTDSIPLLALPLKALSPLLPPSFQYFGLWILSCYLLLALFAWRLLARLIPQPTASHGALRTCLRSRSTDAVQGKIARKSAAYTQYVSILRAIFTPQCAVQRDRTQVLRMMGVLLVLLSPPLLLRGYGHEALMAHWLILAAIEQTLQAHRSRRWALWLGLAVLTHAYLAVMVAAFWFASLIHAIIQRTPSLTRLLIGSLILWTGLIALAWLAGYVVPGSSSLRAEGYGHYSANLLTYFDPMDWQAFLNTFQRSDPSAAEWSRLLPPLGHAHHDQYEGFAYLGAGGILALGAALVLLPFRPRITAEYEHRPQLAPALLMAGTLFILGLSTTITLGSHVLFSYSFPAPLQHLLEIFRASGRFVWPLYYLILMLSVAVIARGLRPRYALPLLALIVSLQIYDLAPKLSEFHQHHRLASIQCSATPPTLEPLLNNATQLIVLPRPQGDDYLPWVQLALAHRLSLNLGVVARADNNALLASDTAILNALASPTGKLPAGSVTILTDATIPIAAQHTVITDPTQPTWRIIYTPAPTTP